MALICVISASATQKMYVETTSGDGIMTTVIEASLVDSVFHWETTDTKSVRVLAGMRIPYEFPQGTLKRIYFTPESKDINGDLYTISPCRIGMSSDDDNIPSMSFQYKPESKQLKLTFSKLQGFCCNDQWLALLAYKGDTLYIEPKQPGPAPCDCICPYTVSFTLYNIEARKYHFMAMDYPDGFDIDLAEKTEGIIYKAPKGIFQKTSKCLDEEYAKKREALEMDGQQGGLRNPLGLRVAEADTLVSYQYDPENNELLIVSHGLKLICCSEISSITTFRNNTIFISTGEEGISICDCMCILDVTTKVKNIEAKKYRFNVDGDEFEVDFSQSTEGAILRQ